MFLVDLATLTCPHCGQKEKLTMPEVGYKKQHLCSFCAKEIQTSEKTCCVFCEFSDMYCLQKQKMGSCSW